MAKDVVVTAEKIQKRKKFRKLVKLALLLLLLLLIVLYIVLQIIYSNGRFTIFLGSEGMMESGISLYDNLDDPTGKRKLEAEALEVMDNISWKWLPDNVDTEADGAHNGENYIAYSFYLENQSNETIHYWYQIIVDDVIKNADEAIRIGIYLNGELTTYAKESPLSGGPEKAGAIDEITVPFKKDKIDKEDTIIIEKRANFSPGDLDRFTIVIWLEGDDPECVDAIKGGVVRMHMKLTEEKLVDNE